MLWFPFVIPFVLCPTPDLANLFFLFFFFFGLENSDFPPTCCYAYYVITYIVLYVDYRFMLLVVTINYITQILIYCFNNV